MKTINLKQLYYPLYAEDTFLEVEDEIADLSFAKQITVASCAGQGQHENIVLNAVDQQPVRLDVALPVAYPVSGQSMVFVLFRKRFTHCQGGNHILQQPDL